MSRIGTTATWTYESVTLDPVPAFASVYKGLYKRPPRQSWIHPLEKPSMNEVVALLLSDNSETNGMFTPEGWLVKEKINNNIRFVNSKLDIAGWHSLECAKF
jgi:hypothetical protein